jgi:hypothetical protein
LSDPPVEKGAISKEGSGRVVSGLQFSGKGMCEGRTMSYQMYQCGIPDLKCRSPDKVNQKSCVGCKYLELTSEEKKRRDYLVAELKLYNETPFPNGAAIIYESFVEGAAPVNCSIWPRAGL